ncbi:MAG: hypothetical protein E7423_08315 [Ruminococcaceae bacterium]|jgi:hypothetical protein|nr:hypothetical protein [Oscillospiraceae bacterium]
MDKYNFALEQHTFGEGHGPSVVITGGIHGDEQTGSHTARLVIRMLKSARRPPHRPAPRAARRDPLSGSKRLI